MRGGYTPWIKEMTVLASCQSRLYYQINVEKTWGSKRDVGLLVPGTDLDLFSIPFFDVLFSAYVVV